MRIIYTPHCYAFERLDIGPVARLAYRAVEAVLSLNTTVFAACSPREARLSRHPFSGAAVSFVPNVPPRGDWADAHWSGFVPDGSPIRVVASGRRSPQKDPDYFVRCVRELRRANVQVAAAWIGTDPEFGAHGEELDIEVSGWLPRSEALKAVSRSALYIHTGLWEGFPLAVLEAIDMGVATVVRDVPAFEGIDLPKVGSEEDLAQLVRRILDPADRQELWKSGLDAVSDFTRERQRQALRHIYEIESM